MTSAIGSSTSFSSWSSTQASQQMPRRPDTAKMSQDLFTQLDSSSKGYLEQSDFESALSGLSSTSLSAEELFTALDSDENGQVTQDEFSSRLEQLSQQLDSQAQQMRMAESGMGAMGGMPPPPPPPSSGSDSSSDDSGLTLDELSSMASSSTDSTTAAIFSDLASNFDVADADSDGKVTAGEARAYGDSLRDSQNQSASSSTSDTTEARLLKQIMELAASYRSDNSTGISGALLSAIA